MNIDLKLSGAALEAAVLTLWLAACADLEVSEEENARLLDVLVKETGWADADAAQALLAKADARVRAISDRELDRPGLLKELRPVGEQIGDIAAREVVLALALQVASTDGLDDDERLGMKVLIEAFGADAARVHELAG